MSTKPLTCKWNGWYIPVTQPHERYRKLHFPLRLAAHSTSFASHFSPVPAIRFGICLHGGNFTNWALTVPRSATTTVTNIVVASVTNDTTGAELLYSSTGYNGQQACIAHNSYYDDTRNNHYSNGAALYNNINSSKQDSSFACNGG